MRTKIKRQSKRTMSVILAVVLLVSCLFVGSVTTVNATDWQTGWTTNAGTNFTLYYDNSISGWTSVKFKIGRIWAGYNQACGYSIYEMTKVTGTDNIYSVTIDSWNNYNDFFFVNGGTNGWHAGTNETGVKAHDAQYTAFTTPMNFTLAEDTSYYFIGQSAAVGTTATPNEITVQGAAGGSGATTSTDYTTYQKQLSVAGVEHGVVTAKYTDDAGAEQTIAEGGNATFLIGKTVTVTETPDTYYTAGNATVTYAGNAASVSVASGGSTFTSGGTDSTVTGSFTLLPALSAPTNVQVNGKASDSVNAGGSSALTWTASTGAGSYQVYKDGTAVGTPVTGTSYTIENTAENAGAYTVKAIPSNASANSPSAASDSADLQVIVSKYALTGYIDSNNIVGSTVEPLADDATGDDKNARWSTYLTEFAIKDTTETPGVFTKQITTQNKTTVGKDSEDNFYNIYIGIADSDDTQWGFRAGNNGGWYNSNGQDYAVADVDPKTLYLVSMNSSNKGGSFILKHGRNYTITLDQTTSYTEEGWAAAGSETYPKGKITFSSTFDLNVAPESNECGTVVAANSIAALASASSGSLTGLAPTANGTDYYFKVTPNTGWEIADVTHDDTDNTDINITLESEENGSRIYKVAALNSNLHVTVNFTEILHTITATPESTKRGTVTGGGDVREGTNATITATPNPGYVFSSWDIDGESNNTNPYTFNNVTAAHTAVAHFSAPTFSNITIQTVNDSTSEPITGQDAATAGATSGTVESNISVTAKEIANMTFVGWTSENGFFNNASALSTNFHPTANGAVIVAHYVEQYTVNITAPSTTEGKIVVTDASGNVVTNGQKVDKGTELTITATPKAKYKVTKITVNGTENAKSGNYGAAATETATVSGDTTISAAFQKDLTVNISVISNDTNKGTVAVTGKTLTSNKTTAQIGETLTLVATQKSGNKFVGWAFYPETAVEYVDGKKSTDATTQVRVKAGFYAEATFAEASTAPSMSDLTVYPGADGQNKGRGVWAGIHTSKEGDYTRQPLYYKKISDSRYDLYIHLNVGASNDFANHQIQDNYLIYLIAGKDDDPVQFVNTKYQSSDTVSKDPSGTSLISEAGKENNDSKYAVKFKTNKASEVFIKIGWINNLGSWDLSSRDVVIYPVGSPTPITPTPSFDNTNNNIIYAKNGTVAYDKDDASKKNSGATSEYGTITVVSGEALDVDDVLGLPGYKTDGYEGHKMYYYDDTEDSSIKVRVTMNTTYKNSGYAVHGFVVNGETFEATEGATDGVYEGVITIPAGTGNVEITPVYYNKTQEEAGNYFKFYVNPSNDKTYKTHWGETVALFTWYGSGQQAGDGTYPGQPLLKDGSGKLYALVAKAYINPATGEMDGTKPLNGLLLDNYYENEHVHRKFMTETQKKNYQTYDYKDLVKIRNLQGGTEPTPGYYDVIEFDMKYKANSSWNGDHQQADYSGVNHSGNSKLKTDNISNLATKYNDWEDLKDYDGHTINLIGENIEATKRNDDNCLYVVVAGNQNYKTEVNGQGYIGDTANNDYKEAIGEWATVWIVYDWDGNYLMQAPPSYFIANSNDNNPFFNYIYEKDGTSPDTTNYRHTPVKISYELEDTAGDSTFSTNTGIRLDGRWLYSSTNESTQAHIRVAKRNNDGTLAFFDPTDLEDDATSATGETAAGVADMTDKDGVYTTDPNYDNRTTTASLRANIGNGYKFVEFVKMKSTASADGTLKAYYNGYSSNYADYDKIPSEGSGHDMTIDTEYYIVAIVDEVPNTALHITHEKYAGPNNHGGLGYYYVSFSGTAANGDSITYTNVKGASGILIEDFTTKFPYENDAEVTITITTRMAGTNVFVDWFKNNNKAYERLVSPDSSVYGSNDPVSYAYKVKVRDLYNADHTYLAQNTINFYSDIDSVGKVNIDHKLLSTSAAKGTTKNQVKVISEDGNTVVHDYGVSESLTSVGSTYMKANSTNKLQITLTLDHESAISTFRGFYLDETPTAMITQTVGDIQYAVDTTNETATITIPISYFFIVDDETGEKVFDASKKDIIYYSALDLVAYNYSITYTYTSYENLYGDQTYSVTGTFTQDDIDNYLTVSNEVKDDDDSDNLTTALWFKDDNARKAFLNKLGPYENNYRKKFYWNTDLKKDDDDNGVGIKYQGISKTYIIDVNTNEKSSKYVNLYFRFPYAINDSKVDGWKAIPGSDGKVLYTPVYNDKKVGDLNYMSWWAYNSVKDYSDPNNLPQFVTAPSVIYNGDTELYFRYWTVKTVPTDVNPVSVEYTKCYSREFNLAIMQDTIVEPVFTALTETEIADNYTPSPHAEAMKSENATGATITFLENSRNQWNNSGGGTVKSEWKTQGDRMYTDFVLSFASESDIQYKTYANSTYMAGLIIEKAAELDIDENGDYVTKTEDEYHSMYDAVELTNAHATELKGFIEGNSTSTPDSRGGYKYQKAEFDANTLDNKNRIEYYYSMSVRSHSGDFVDNGAKNYVYRAYSYIKKVSTGKVELLSKPVYFTIYDMASITNAQEGLDFDKITT